MQRLQPGAPREAGLLPAVLVPGRARPRGASSSGCSRPAGISPALMNGITWTPPTPGSSGGTTLLTAGGRPGAGLVGCASPSNAAWSSCCRATLKATPSATQSCSRSCAGLVDDRRPSFEDWLERKLGGLAPGIGCEVEAWLRTLHDGGPRTRARNQGTVWNYLNAVRPALAVWSGCYQHLREVTRDDVVA